METMAVSEKAMRFWKLVSFVSIPPITFHLVFQNEYQSHSRVTEEHVFTGVQKWYHDKVEKVFGIPAPVPKARLEPSVEESQASRQKAMEAR